MSHPLRVATAALAVALTFAGAGCGGSDEESAAPPPPPATSPPTENPARTAPERARSGPRVSTVATGLEAPWEIAFLPGGGALVTERAGRVRMLSPRLELRREPIAEVEVNAVGEAGLLGLAVDPRFERNRFVYLYRTTGSGNEVLRYRLADGRLEQEETILDGLAASAIHDGGRIHFGPDGLLYVSTGEAGNPDLSQDRDSLNGKLLRLEDFRGDGGRPEVISLGHRNVQGFDWQPGSDRLFATEFGPDSNDEVNLIRAGRNYGWPEAQGDDGAPRFEPALVDYEEVIAPSGATFVSQPGSRWTGDFLLAALRGEQLRRVSLSGTRVTGNEPLFAGRFGRLRTVVEGPDGAIYALTNNTDGRGSPREGDDRILRIVPPRSAPSR
ncbi:MAG: PQQ-dependent sugar dehydrogenase [Thermoleophilaceae bacterium]